MNKKMQYISRSLQIAKWHKSQSYGHYCNLVKKYNYSRISYREFNSSDIMLVEHQYLRESRAAQLALIY